MKRRKNQLEKPPGDPFGQKSSPTISDQPSIHNFQLSHETNGVDESSTQPSIHHRQTTSIHINNPIVFTTPMLINSHNASNNGPPLIAPVDSTNIGYNNIMSSSSTSSTACSVSPLTSDTSNQISINPHPAEPLLAASMDPPQLSNFHHGNLQSSHVNFQLQQQLPPINVNNIHPNLNFNYPQYDSKISVASGFKTLPPPSIKNYTHHLHQAPPTRTSSSNQHIYFSPQDSSSQSVISGSHPITQSLPYSSQFPSSLPATNTNTTTSGCFNIKSILNDDEKQPPTMPKIQYAPTSNPIKKIARYLTPIITIVLDKLSGLPEAENLKVLLAQSEEYLAYELEMEKKQDLTDPLESPINLSGANLTEEQVLQCLSCYFLAYQSVYPMLEPSYWYRLAKKVWRNMEYGNTDVLGLPLNQNLSEKARAKQEIEIAIIYALVALGSQECPRRSIFSGINPLDWAVCYFMRSTQIIKHHLPPGFAYNKNSTETREMVPSIRLAQYACLASMFECTAGHDDLSLSMAQLSIKIIHIMGLLDLGRDLNVAEQQEKQGVSMSIITSRLYAKYHPHFENSGSVDFFNELYDAHRVSVSSFLWNRLIHSLQANFVIRTIKLHSGGKPDVNTKAFQIIGINSIESLIGRVALQDVVNQVMELMSSRVVVNDPLYVTKKLEDTIQSLLEFSAHGNKIDLDKYNLSLHYKFASGYDGLSPTTSSQPLNLHKESENENNNSTFQIQEKTKRWFRTHLVAIFFITRLLIYRPCSIATLIFKDNNVLKTNMPIIFDYFETGAQKAYGIMCEIYNEMIVPKIKQRHEEKSGKKNEEDNDDDDFGKFDLFISTIAADISASLFLFYGMNQPIESDVEKSKMQSQDTTNKGDVQNSNNEKKESKGNAISCYDAIERFRGCVDFMFYLQDLQDKTNKRRDHAINALISKNKENDNKQQQKTEDNGQEEEGEENKFKQNEDYGTEKALPLSPTCQYILYISKLVQNAPLMRIVVQSITHDDRVKIAKCLFTKNSTDISELLGPFVMSSDEKKGQEKAANDKNMSAKYEQRKMKSNINNFNNNASFFDSKESILSRTSNTLTKQNESSKEVYKSYPMMAKSLSESLSSGNSTTRDQNILDQHQREISPLPPSSDANSSNIKSGYSLQSSMRKNSSSSTRGINSTMIYNSTNSGSSSSIYSLVDTTSIMDASTTTSPILPPPISVGQGLQDNHYHHDNLCHFNKTSGGGGGDSANFIPTSASAPVGHNESMHVPGLDPKEYDEDQGDGLIREEENEQEEIKRLWKNILNLFV